MTDNPLYSDLLLYSRALLLRLELEQRETNNRQMAGAAILPDLRRVIDKIDLEISSSIK